jgi:hypothetical protein
MRSTRLDISDAARRENVIRRIRWGSAPRAIRCATRWARVFVLPDPAPANDQEGSSHVIVVSDAVLDCSALLRIQRLKI